MGTTYTIKQFSAQPLSAEKVNFKLRQMNTIFSTWNDSSELSLFNKNPTNQWVKVSDALFFVLREAEKINQQTHGYFDPGIGRLLDIWGFGVKSVADKPDSQEIKVALEQSSIRHLQFVKGRIKKHKDIQLNLSGIAKGFAVDELARLLENSGVARFLVEIGGEIRVRGKWNVGVEMPNTKFPIALELNNQAVATSGDYRNYFVWEGRRYAHILQPDTGLPATSDLASVSVIHNQAMLADAYATAMLAMGSKKASVLARQLNLPVILIFNQQHAHKVVKINL